MPVGPKPPFSPTGFWGADERYELNVNRILAKVGIKSFHEFLGGLREYLKGVPELSQVATAAGKIGCEAVLSGGSARAIVSAYLKDIEKTGKPTVKADRSLFQMLEGSDVDVLVIKGAGVVPAADLAQLSRDLNRISGAQLVAPLPSVERRLYTAEWDVVDAVTFSKLNQAFGGDSPSLFGIGLTSAGSLTLYDPYNALEGVFRGKLDYVAGDRPYEHEMVVKGQFDPSLDGLRIIRIAGQMREVGVELTDGARDALRDLGDEAHRRLWEVQARVLHSPDGKLARRWAKYTKKVWVDHRDPAYARELLQKSGYLELLTMVGMRSYTLYELPTQRGKAIDAHPTMQALVNQHRVALEEHIVDLSVETLFTWQTAGLARLFLDEKRVFGTDVSELGPGLRVTTDETLAEGGSASKLLSVAPTPGVRVLDLAASRALVDSIVEEARPAYQAQGGGALDPLDSAGGEAWRSRALGELYQVLGVDGAVAESDAVLTHRGAIEAFTYVDDIADRILEQLHNKLGGRTEHGVRALLASRGRAGIEELKMLMEQGAVTVSDLFPPGGPPGGLFADVPTREPDFAQFLALQLVSTRGLSPAQHDSVRAAIEYLRGDLPPELSDLVKRTA